MAGSGRGSLLMFRGMTPPVAEGRGGHFAWEWAMCGNELFPCGGLLPPRGGRPWAYRRAEPTRGELGTVPAAGLFMAPGCWPRHHPLVMMVVVVALSSERDSWGAIETRASGRSARGRRPRAAQHVRQRALQVNARQRKLSRNCRQAALDNQQGGLPSATNK
jgi:hypothetical protein